MSEMKSLERLRLAAGYQTVKEFAEVVGIKRTTYMNYESDPARMPLAKAVELADFFGVSVDEVIGHKPLELKIETDPEKLKGRVQRRYEALSVRQRQYIEEALDFAEYRDSQRKRAKNSQMKAEYLTKVFRFFDELFADDVARALYKGATTDEYKAYFEDWLERDLASDLDVEAYAAKKAMEESLEKARKSRGEGARVFAPNWATVKRYIESDEDVDACVQEFRERRGSKMKSEFKYYLQAFDEAVGPDEETMKEAVRIMGPNGSFYEYATISMAPED